MFGQPVSRLSFHSYPKGDFLLFQVHFQPGGLYRLLGIPGNELTATFEDAESIIDSELQHVNEQIANATSYGEMILRVESYLLLLLSQPNSLSLDWLAGQANLSPRQFERKFTKRMSIGPKLYSRISRFYQAFRYKEQHPGTDWLTIALRFGYYDYNHLVKDFRQFANVTPRVLLEESARRPEIIVDF